MNEIQQFSCPNCHQKAGWFEKRIINYKQYYKADGSIAPATESKASTGRGKFCAHCGHSISRLILGEPKEF